MKRFTSFQFINKKINSSSKNPEDAYFLKPEIRRTVLTVSIWLTYDNNTVSICEMYP